MRKSLLFSILLTPLLYADTQPSIEHYHSLFETQKQEFLHFKKKQTHQFQNYKQQQQDAYEAYKKELSRYWQDPKLSSQKEWIRYSKDQKTRSSINFKDNTITLETFAKSKKQAVGTLQKSLATLSIQDTKTAISNDPLEQKIAAITPPNDVVQSDIDTKPVLAPVIYKHKPTRKEVVTYVTQHINDATVVEQKKPTKTGDKLYEVVVSLPKDTTYQRSKFYLNEVRENGALQRIQPEVLFAVIHTESAFNPKATSYVPAYGLMQIVPHTAGVDSYYYLYHVKKKPSSHYLYNAHNNIRLGSAYLHLLFYSYLRYIKNKQSRLYCTIAAYNTGAGNVAWAFTKHYNVKKAAQYINTLSPDEVYAHLLQHLKYEETKNYLKRVTKRIAIYRELYATR